MGYWHLNQNFNFSGLQPGLLNPSYARTRVHDDITGAVLEKRVGENVCPCYGTYTACRRAHYYRIVYDVLGSRDDD